MKNTKNINFGTTFTPGQTNQNDPGDVQPITMMGSVGKKLASKTAPVSAFVVTKGGNK
jgi:hypothetical protein